jgi:hypothetical protein
MLQHVLSINKWHWYQSRKRQIQKKDFSKIYSIKSHLWKATLQCLRQDLAQPWQCFWGSTEGTHANLIICQHATISLGVPNSLKSFLIKKPARKRLNSDEFRQFLSNIKEEGCQKYEAAARVQSP